jgi:RNA polymerase sigma factor (sigma-70 family)
VSVLLPQYASPEELERRCTIVVERIIREHGWRLLEPSELVRRTLAQLRVGTADRLESAAIGAYCMAMHTACSGAEGSSRQNQAYGELARYLYSLTFVRFADLSPDVREDVTQSALERIFKSFERCREPVAFLAFAGLHLLDAARPARRHAVRPVESLDQKIGATDELLGELLPDEQPEPVERVLGAERRAALERLLEEIATDHPRATQQLAILRMTWLDDLDDLAIGRRLGISLSSIYAARSRLIKTIKSEPKWQARARELGLLFDEV